MSTSQIVHRAQQNSQYRQAALANTLANTYASRARARVRARDRRGPSARRDACDLAGAARGERVRLPRHAPRARRRRAPTRALSRDCAGS
jgi:hypothetical protein